MEYKLYIPDIKWKILCGFKILIIVGILSYIFFDSLLGFLLVTPMIPIFWFREKKDFVEKRRFKVKENFKDFIALLSGNLGAGYSLENSFSYAYEEYQKAYKNESVIKDELVNIINGIRCNKRLEDMLMEFGARCGIKEIEDFAELIVTAKIYGGNIIKLIKQTTANYKENCMTEMEIQTMISAKKLESKIMILAPLIIVLYMRLTNGNYMMVLYETLWGRVVMTICMWVVIIAGLLINKIMKIEV